MKSIAYIITRESTAELIEENLFTPILQGKHGVQVAAFYFVGDGVYHLIKGSRTAKSMKLAMSREKIPIYACEISIKNRKLQNIIIDGVNKGTLKDFYDTASNVDHIISF
jgi:sulfur transfer complex TusBCD TusB component (DsrH family)